MRLLAALAGALVAALTARHLLAPPSRSRGPSWIARRRALHRAWLAEAGATVSVEGFWCAATALGLAGFVTGVYACGSALVAVVPALALAAMPRARFARRRRQRLQEVRAAWPDAVRDLLASIAAGRALPGALEDLARSGPAPLRAPFVRFGANARVMGAVAALELVKQEFADATSDRVIEVLIVAHERGGALVGPILEDLAASIADDVRLAAEIETAALEMTINARAVMVMPWLVLVLLTATDAGFRHFYQSSAGGLVIVLGAAMSASAAALLGRLGRPLDEPRVFEVASGPDLVREHRS